MTRMPAPGDPESLEKEALEASLGSTRGGREGQEGRTAGYSGSWSEKGGTLGLQEHEELLLPQAQSPLPAGAPTLSSCLAEMVGGQGRGLCPPRLFPQDTAPASSIPFYTELSDTPEPQAGSARLPPQPHWAHPEGQYLHPRSEPITPNADHDWVKSTKAVGSRAQSHHFTEGTQGSEGQCLFQNYAAHFSRAILFDHLS